jgi:cob(I)alamin adenosyltransferase
VRISKVVTKTGDGGDTGLAGGARVSKASTRVAAYGDVDELNSLLGLARVHEKEARLSTMLEHIQHQLFVVGADLATPAQLDSTRVEPAEVQELEAYLEELLDHIDPLREFVLPGGGEAGALLHVARTVARRAERTAVALAAEEPVSKEIIIYLNRLSDLLFVMARYSNHQAGAAETLAQFKKKPS